MPPTDPNVIGREVALLAESSTYALAVTQYFLTMGFTKLDAQGIKDLTDPPAGKENDPNVLALNAFKVAAYRWCREKEAWDSGSLGNAAYWAVPPDFGNGPGNPPQPAPAPGGGGSGLTPQALAPLILPTMQLVLNDPTLKAQFLGMLQAAMTGAPSPGGATAKAPA